ncbi:MAG: protein phosphatase 2C domain-containing protein [Bifidobacteriaceae bacterium]|nr:protein phosphatase 2C domain-containing protein [Bifidobacteriaceae bacterium]
MVAPQGRAGSPPAGHGAQLRARAAAASEVGKVRAVNEDAYVARSPVFMVADGMGGHNAGDLAAQAAVEQMGRLADLARDGRPLTQGQVADAVEAARRRIAELPRSAVGRAAGTTLTGAVLTGPPGAPQWLVVNLGDSRTYRFAQGALVQLTRDHSEVQALVAAGLMTPLQARSHPRRHVVTKALGAGVVCQADFEAVPARLGDRLLICSDGLTEHVGDRRLAQILGRSAEPAGAVAALVRCALAAGGKDNISVIVVDLVQAEP